MLFAKIPLNFAIAIGLHSFFYYTISISTCSTRNTRTIEENESRLGSISPLFSSRARMYEHISEFSFFAFTLHPARKRIENQTVAVKKKVKASLHLTFTLIPQDGGKISAHGEKRSEKRKREHAPSLCLHRKSLVFNTIHHMNIKTRGNEQKHLHRISLNDSTLQPSG